MNSVPARTRALYYMFLTPQKYGDWKDGMANGAYEDVMFFCTSKHPSTAQQYADTLVEFRHLLADYIEQQKIVTW